MSNYELKTGALTEDELENLSGKMENMCNEFAFWYLENVNENAVVKDAIVGNTEHCYVYDPELDVAIDGTLGQFNGKADAGAWSGDVHPHTNDDDEVFEWTDRSEFEAHYSGFNSPYVVN